MIRSIMLACELGFNTPEEQEESEDILLRLLGTVARMNLRFLRKNPDLPRLYDAGITYCLPDQLAAPRIPRNKMRAVAKLLRDCGATDETIIAVLRFLNGIEVFMDIPTLYARKRADCDVLACARVAELWNCGVAASPYLDKRPNDRGGITYHAIVLWPDDRNWAEPPDESREDPSVILGMGGESRAEDRAHEMHKNELRRAALEARASAMIQGGANPAALGAKIEAFGLTPRGGFKRAA